jgi:hypothetical protein
MHHTPTYHLPPLAGLSTHADSARLGYTVAEDVERLLHYAWLEKAAMELALAWINPTPEWEAKEAFSLHLYLDAQHAAWLRERVGEMRSPAPHMDASPSGELQQFIDELFAAKDTLEKITALYVVLKPALLAAYRLHLEHSHPVADYPTRRMLRMIIADEEEVLAWGRPAVEAVTPTPETRARAVAWSAHLNAYLLAAGGVMGDGARPDSVPASRATQPFTPDYFPRRDSRFDNPWNFVFMAHKVARMEGVPADERTLALMCKRALEMDVPEVMSRLMLEAQGQPWEYYVQMGRQLWDEARHAMLGTIYLAARGVNWTQVPLHLGFSLRLNQHLSALDAHAVLYTIEQGLMPANTGKRYEWATTRETTDELAQLFQDFDWADEVLHVHIGRQWLLGTLKVSMEEAMSRGKLCESQSTAALKAYEGRGIQHDWWPDFVRQVLGKDSASITAS